MVKKLLLFFVLVFGAYPLLAQSKTVTGTVTDATNGSPLPGVNVLVQGTTTGSQTDFDGNYSIEAESGNVLVFSFLGMKTQSVTVGASNTINVSMQEDAEQLGEVVVTALGIKREEKALTYAQQTVRSDELTKTRDPNFMNSISGKAAGVEIKKSSSGAGGSTKIVLRGNKSLNGDSSPLFVIDGIPMANNKGGQPGMWGGTDSGDGLSAINPDDIESISILRGANAAVLYGSQGANGVVVITTKQGASGKTTVTLNTGYSFEHYQELPDLQFKYGAQGGTNESWSNTPGNYDDSFVEDFFQTGHNFNNSVSISGGNDRTTAYFSYANITSTGITPENKYKKDNATFRQSTKFFNDKVTVSSGVILSIEETKNRLPAGYYLNPLTGLYMFPRERNFYDFKNNYQVFNTERNLYAQNWFVPDHHQSNPYWIIYNQPRVDNTKRVIANASVKWDILSNLSLQVRGNYDYAAKEQEQQHAATSNETNVHRNGAWNYRKYDDQLGYADVILSYDTNFGEGFSLNGVLGASYQKTKYGTGVGVGVDGNGTGTLGLIYPNEFFFQNLPTNVPVTSLTDGEVIKQGAFVNAQLGYKEMLFLDLSGRNDWASTLALTGNQSYFYPAVGLTTILSEMFDMGEKVSFAKLRASYTQVGNEVPFNRIFPRHSIAANGGVNRNTYAPFTDAKPEKINSLEFGVDWRFFNNRLGVDFTYYSLTSRDQYVEQPLDPSDPISQGIYTDRYINAGKITNKGVEFTISATPVRNDNLQWVTAFNFATNKNKIVDIGPDDEKFIELGTSEGFFSRLYEGGSFNDLYVLKFLRDDQGRIMFEDDGTTMRKTTAPELIGNLDPDWSLGWNNNISFGKFNMGALINGKFGGNVFSQTESMLDGAGVSQRTADARDAGGVTVNGVDPSGAAITNVSAQDYYSDGVGIGGRNGVGEAYVYDRTNIKLSQLSIGYDIDVNKLNLPIKAATLSFVGNNLFFIYKDAPFDPELAMSTNRNAQGLDNFNLPSTATYGFNLKVTF
ncbi:MAG: SusC/RagA family TonB-linked outer membrane protein [Flavobacteriaceae bacterium]